MSETKLDCQLVHVLMFVVVPAHYVSMEQGGCLSSSLLLSMFLDLRQASRRSSYVLSWLLFLVWMLESCFLSFDNIRPLPTYLIKRWAGFTIIGIVILGNICRTFRNEMWPAVQFYFFQYCPVQYSFSWNLDSKFCLHAAGGIYVEQSFTNSGGKIQISGSSAKNGGAVLRCSSWVFGTILKKL